MSKRVVNEITKIVKTENKGYWLWDENRGMNLAMRAESEEAALIEALEYYQKRLVDVESDLKAKNEMIRQVHKVLDVVPSEYECKCDY